MIAKPGDPTKSLAASPDVLRTLAGPHVGPVASLYAPVAHALPEARRMSAELQHRLDALAESLIAAGAAPAQVQTWREQASASEMRVRAWAANARALALFYDGEGFRLHALSVPAPELATVGEHLSLRPLAHAVHMEPAFRVLTLSANHVALFDGDAWGLEPHPVEGLPQSLVDALGDELGGRELFGHSVPTSHGSVLIGYGVSTNELRATDLERFHRAVVRPLVHALEGKHEPLVLATDAANSGRFRELCHLPALLPGEVRGNPDYLDRHELHARALEVVRAATRAEDDRRATAFDRVRNQGKGFVELDQIGPAAVAGRIRRLWVAEGARVTGRLNAAGAPIYGEPEDLLDAITAWTLRLGGEVVEVEAARMPAESIAAAELR